ncbi:DUF3298 and DUF4163 domain-containing protein [uncultured Flavobacterium sp.]|uniref:DUF3298 and DUF4163 domain-containing protein n=1 Tax=uncultured Flavobacterium sp. TaxID=165435 RepID=UPI0025D229E2|nr:DUF3298 and DUF4163 domain-containing protein [uncultured Flavobacterium sp.]
MKYCFTLAFALLVLTGCKKETEETTTETEMTEGAKALSFENKNYSDRSAICKKECTSVDIKVPEAVNGDKAVADSINQALFRVARSIVYFGEQPTNAKDYKELASMFIKSYDGLAGKYPEEAKMAWEAKINATKEYQSGNIINFNVNNYMFTGGAHGYEGNRSLIVDAKTGRTLERADILKDEKGLTAMAEKKFRTLYNVPAGKPINSTGMMFENNKFSLPQNIFFTESGIRLLYNPMEIASFADGAKELAFPYSEVEAFLKVK